MKPSPSIDIDKRLGIFREGAVTGEHPGADTIFPTSISTMPPLPKGIENLGSAESLHLQVRGVCLNCKHN